MVKCFPFNFCFKLGKSSRGDTVYISGGMDSTIYPKDCISNISIPNGFVVITKGKDYEHNGKVIYKMTYASGIPAAFMLSHCQNIKINNFVLASTEDDSVVSGLFRDSYGFNNTIENCKLNCNGDGFGIYGDNTTKLNITNDTIIIPYNNLSERFGQDPIWIGNGDGGYSIIDNILIHHGYNVDFGNHPDIIQMYNIGSPSNYQTTIAGNLMIMDNNASTAGQGIYMENEGSNKILIYNNIITMNASTNEVVRINGIDNLHKFSLKVFNNTFVQKNSTNAAFVADLPDTLIFQNNILVANRPDIMLAFGNSSINEINYKNIDYNIYNCVAGMEDKTYFPLITGPSISWTNWQKLGYDIHSDTNKR